LFITTVEITVLQLSD